MRPRLTSKLTVLLLVIACTATVGAAQAAAADSGAQAFSKEASLLAERVAAIAAETPTGQFPVATTENFELRLVGGKDWTSGFLAGALWRVYDLEKTPATRSAALAATLDHFNFEHTRTHDLGFMYGESSVAAYKRLCMRAASAVPECARLRSSGLRAARTLLALSRTTGQRIIPMSAKRCNKCASGQTETIVDSMMNLPLLYWATRTSGNRAYRNLALRHAGWVERHLERRDGSIYQAAHYSRRSTRPRITHHTHQGHSTNSVWSRGLAWSIYGFADAGREFRSRRFLGVAERNAAYLASHLPADGVPPWDFRAGADAARDVSAGVIAAAGLFHLADACSAVRGGCVARARWQRLARRVLAGSLAGIRTTPPLGYLGGMVYNMRSPDAWKHGAELTFGLDYALEAIELARND